MRVRVARSTIVRDASESTYTAVRRDLMTGPAVRFFVSARQRERGVRMRLTVEEVRLERVAAMAIETACFSAPLLSWYRARRERGDELTFVRVDVTGGTVVRVTRFPPRVVAACVAVAAALSVVGRLERERSCVKLSCRVDIGSSEAVTFCTVAGFAGGARRSREQSDDAVDERRAVR